MRRPLNYVYVFSSVVNCVSSSGLVVKSNVANAIAAQSFGPEFDSRLEHLLLPTIAQQY